MNLSPSALVCTTSRNVRFIHVSQLTRSPLSVSPLLSSTSMGWPVAAVRRPSGSCHNCQCVLEGLPAQCDVPWRQYRAPGCALRAIVWVNMCRVKIRQLRQRGSRVACSASQQCCRRGRCSGSSLVNASNSWLSPMRIWEPGAVNQCATTLSFARAFQACLSIRSVYLYEKA